MLVILIHKLVRTEYSNQYLLTFSQSFEGLVRYHGNIQIGQTDESKLLAQRQFQKQL